MKTLILVLALLVATPALAAQPNIGQPQYGCKASFTDHLGNQMDLGFDQESGGIGEAYIINQTPKSALQGSVLKFESITGNTSLKVKVKETKGTSKTKLRAGKKFRSFKASFAVNLDGDKMLFNGSCIEQLKK